MCSRRAQATRLFPSFLQKSLETGLDLLWDLVEEASKNGRNMLEWPIPAFTVMEPCEGLRNLAEHQAASKPGKSGKPGGRPCPKPKRSSPSRHLADFRTPSFAEEASRRF